jgi:hypothetical protein
LVHTSYWDGIQPSPGIQGWLGSCAGFSAGIGAGFRVTLRRAGAFFAAFLRAAGLFFRATAFLRAAGLFFRAAGFLRAAAFLARAGRRFAFVALAFLFRATGIPPLPGYRSM